MADSNIDVLRNDILAKRLDEKSGKLWGPRDKSLWHEYVYDADPADIVNAAPATHKFVTPDLAAIRKEVMAAGAGTFTKSTDAARAYMFVISTKTVDLENDVIFPRGIDTGLFSKNGPVLLSHDSSKLPIAASDVPFVSGDRVLATARFPAQGVSADSDQALAAIRAGLVKGASVGLIPTRWAFSKDRKLGVDIFESILLEYSVVSLPCCPDALLLGPVSSAASAAPASATRSTQSREERIADANRFRRIAYRA
jgi:phage head maturation protease